MAPPAPNVWERLDDLVSDLSKAVKELEAEVDRAHEEGHS